MGLIRPESGQVLLNGRPTAELPKEELGRTISMVYQNPEEMFIKDSNPQRHRVCDESAESRRL